MIAVLALGCRAVLGISDGNSDSGGAGDGAASDEAGGITDAGAPDVQLVSVFCTKLSPPANVCDDFDKDPFLKGWDNFFGHPDPAVNMRYALRSVAHLLHPRRLAR